MVAAGALGLVTQTHVATRSAQALQYIQTRVQTSHQHPKAQARGSYFTNVWKLNGTCARLAPLRAAEHTHQHHDEHEHGKLEDVGRYGPKASRCPRVTRHSSRKERVGCVDCLVVHPPGNQMKCSRPPPCQPTPSPARRSSLSACPRMTARLCKPGSMPWPQNMQCGLPHQSNWTPTRAWGQCSGIPVTHPLLGLRFLPTHPRW